MAVAVAAKGLGSGGSRGVVEPVGAMALVSICTGLISIR